MPMPSLITRRQFTAAAGLTLALVVLPLPALAKKKKSAESEDDNFAGDLAKEPLLIGAPELYQAASLYKKFSAQGVWIVSDGKRLIALSSLCTHTGCPVDYEPESRRFVCGCHGSEFDLQGINLSATQKAKRPLERCRLTLVDTPQGRQLQVDPTQLFTKNKSKDKDEFNQPGSYFSLEEPGLDAPAPAAPPASPTPAPVP